VKIGKGVKMGKRANMGENWLRVKMGKRANMG
jgi:hypothetical protein